MTGLPRTIIKKYGVSKKAWAVFRASKNTTSRAQTRVGRTTMARRKSRFGARVSRVARKSYRKSSGGGYGLMSIAVPAALYGAVRAPVGGFTAPIVSGMVPDSLSSYSGNIGNGLASYAAMKWGSGLVRNVGRAGLTVEIASATAQATAGLTGTMATSSGQTSSSQGAYAW